MGQGIVGIEWRDEQAGSRYPFTDSSSLTSSGVAIAKDMFLDAVIYIMGASAPIYLRTITIASDLVTITISDSSSTLTATSSFDPFDIPSELAIFDSYNRPAGLFVCNVESLEIVKNWPLGTYSFGDGAEFVASVTIPMPEASLSGFLLPDGTLMTGDVILAAEDGVILSKDSNSIRVDVVGDPLFLRKQCRNDVASTDFFITPRFVKTINNEPANSNGDFTISANTELAADTILRIYPEPSDNSVRIEFVGQQLESVR
jgi:hypothetical protein